MGGVHAVAFLFYIIFCVWRATGDPASTAPAVDGGDRPASQLAVSGRSSRDWIGRPRRTQVVPHRSQKSSSVAPKFRRQARQYKGLHPWVSRLAARLVGIRWTAHRMDSTRALTAHRAGLRAPAASRHPRLSAGLVGCVHAARPCACCLAVCSEVEEHEEHVAVAGAAADHRHEAHVAAATSSTWPPSRCCCDGARCCNCVAAAVGSSRCAYMKTTMLLLLHALDAEQQLVHVVEHVAEHVDERLAARRKRKNIASRRGLPTAPCGLRRRRADEPSRRSASAAIRRRHCYVIRRGIS